MTDKLKQTIKEEVEKLPKGNQAVINDFGWEKISEEIGKKYLLSDSEVNDFQVETLLILIGLEDPEYYTQNIEDNVGTSKDEAGKISDEVVQKIFTPINDLLIENIKKSGKVMNSNSEQNLNFILSGGDYVAFLEKLGEIATPKPEIPTIDKTPATPMITPSLADIKANVQNPPERLESSSRAGIKITDINPVVRPSPEGSTTG